VRRPFPSAPPPTMERIRAYEKMLEAGAPVRLGIISNPFSRRNARSRVFDRLLPRLVPDARNVVNTHSVRDLDNALRFLLLERGVNVLGLNGGDGTLHTAINRLYQLRAEIEQNLGLTIPLPKLLFLNGGTLNIVSRATGTKGNPLRTVKQFLHRSRGKTIERLAVRELALLRVSVDGTPPRYGFVFGSELVANALEMYGFFGEGYTGLTRLLSEVVVGYPLHTRMWQEHGWKLEPPTTSITIDQVAFPVYCTLVAATIDLTLLKGMLPAFRVPSNQPGFFSKLILETGTNNLIRLIPTLMTGGQSPMIRDFPHTQRIRLFGGYTLDGECFLDRSSSGSKRKVLVERAETVLHAVRLD
jgi:hypothetical protein